MHVLRPALNWSADRVSQRFSEFADESHDREGPVYFYGEMVNPYQKPTPTQAEDC